MHKSIVLSIQQSCLPALTPTHNTLAIELDNQQTYHNLAILGEVYYAQDNIRSYEVTNNGMVLSLHGLLDTLLNPYVHPSFDKLNKTCEHYW